MDIAGKNYQQCNIYSARLEWIQSDGDCIIDSGILSSKKSRVDAKLMFTMKSLGPAFGCRNGSYLINCTPGSNTTTIYVQRTGASTTAQIPFDTEWHEVINAYDDRSIDGIKYSSHQGSAECNTNIFIFGYSDDGSISPSKSCPRIAWLKIYDDNTLLRDFIPVRRGNEGYLYDKVSRTLFRNQGTGKFILGPVAEEGIA